MKTGGGVKQFYLGAQKQKPQFDSKLQLYANPQHYYTDSIDLSTSTTSNWETGDELRYDVILLDAKLY